MNRRERKHMEKQLGITKSRSKLSRAEKFEIMRSNILQGKESEKRMKEIRRVQEQGKADENAANRISYIATDLMVNKGIPFVEAYEQAKVIYKEETEASN